MPQVPRSCLAFLVLLLVSCGSDDPDRNVQPAPVAEPGAQANSIRLEWSTDPSAISYNVYYRTFEELDLRLAVKLTGVTSPLTIHHLAAGITHFFQVVAVGPNGEREPSGVAFGVPQGTVTGQILGPTPDSLVGDSIPVRALAQGPGDLTVVARIYDHVVPLTGPAPGSSIWNGVLDLTGIPSGGRQQLQLMVVSQGDTVYDQHPVRHNRAPRAVFTLPGDGSLVSTSQRVIASCEDDAPSTCHVMVYVDLVGVASGEGQVDALANLTQFDNQAIEMYAQVRDADDQLARSETRTMLVTSSPHLEAIAQFGGRLLDVDPTHLLAIDVTGTLLLLKNRASGVVDTIRQLDPSVGETVVYARLFPGGNAILRVRRSSQGSIEEWRDGHLTVLSGAGAPTALAVSGSWAIWNGGPPPVTQTVLFRRNLTTGFTDTLSTNAGNFGNDVNADGTVAFWTTTRQIYLATPDSTTQITTTGRNLYPRTDGTRFVLQRQSTDTTWELVLRNGAAETILGAESKEPLNPDQYELANGWAAFSRPFANGMQIWLRTPGGTESPVSQTGVAASLELLNGDGEVVFLTESGAYRVPPGGSAQPIGPGSTAGRHLFIGGQLYLIVGGGLYRIT